MKCDLSEMPVPLVFATYRIIRDCNQAFADLFGFRMDELKNQSFSRLYPGLSDFVRTGELWRAQMAGGRHYYDERIMTDAAGKRFWCMVNGRSRNVADPFAEAFYCFQPIPRTLPAGAACLTGRQLQIVAMIAQGKTNGEIGADLNLSTRTVESHRARIMRAVGLKNSAELVAWFLSGHLTGAPRTDPAPAAVVPDENRFHAPILASSV